MRVKKNDLVNQHPKFMFLLQRTIFSLVTMEGVHTQQSFSRVWRRQGKVRKEK